MTDEQPETTPAKRPPGRPKANIKKRNANRAPMREQQRMPRGVDESEVLSCKTELYSHQDPLHFPAEVLWQMEHEYGFVGGWFAFEVVGKPVHNVTIRLRQGYQHAERDSFQGLLKPYVPRRDGPIIHEGLAFLVIDKSRYLTLRQLEKREATAAKENMQKSHALQGVDVSMPGGGGHPSALAKNRHRQSFEPGPDIPD
jgi:hypothetical protein